MFRFISKKRRIAFGFLQKTASNRCKKSLKKFISISLHLQKANSYANAIIAFVSNKQNKLNKQYSLNQTNINKRFGQICLKR